MRIVQWFFRQNFIEVGDYDGYFFVDRVEDYDDDEVDDGGCDGCGYLWGQVFLDRVCFVGVFGERCGKYDEYGQFVDNDFDYRGDDEQDLKLLAMSQREFSQELVSVVLGLDLRLYNEGAGVLWGEFYISVTRGNGGRVGRNGRIKEEVFI